MRTRCPVCRSNNVIHLMEMKFLVPDGWKLPDSNDIMHCRHCDLIWYSNNMTQQDYNNYYMEKYGFNYATTLDVDMPRIYSLADVIERYIKDQEALIVDFGGGIEGALVKVLKERGYTRAVNVEVGDSMPFDADLIVSSHVLEHIYDLEWVMRLLENHLGDKGSVLIEVPDANAIGRKWEMPILDFNQKHVNHFSPRTLDILFESRGWELKYAERGQMPANHGYYYRAIYQKVSAFGSGFVQFDSRDRINGTLMELSRKLELIEGDVIVWGCGDYCLFALRNVNRDKMNIVHFVDLDPAYEGATIEGKPVLDHVEGDAPILVIAQGQKESIVESIKMSGYKNRVVVI